MPRTRRLTATLRVLERIPLLPFLVAAYPVLFLFAYNIDEQVTLEPLWAPLGLALGVTAAILLVLRLIVGDMLRASLLAALGAALFFGYGHAWNGASTRLDSQWPLLGAWVAAALVGALLIARGGSWLRPASQLLTVLAVAAVAFNAWSIGAYTILSAGNARAQTTGDTGLGLSAEHRPDVYYLVFDRYAGLETLAAEYGFDNTPFLDELAERGFYVPTGSHANYIKTPLSLTSTLQMEYLDGEVLAEAATSGADRGPIHTALREELTVPHALTELGYTYIHVANWWEPSANNVDADRVYRYDGQSEFAAALSQTTMLRFFARPAASPSDPWDWRNLRQHSVYELARLDEIPEVGGPKYVFAHLLLPHDPYVFDIDGSFMDEEQVAEQGQAESYLRQLQFLNRRILEIVDHILEVSDEPPVIVLQADEGPFPDRYRQDEWGFEWQDATDAQLEEKFGIFNAILLPGVDPEAAGLHPAITPVNTFRIMFNEVFGADLPLLPDRIFAHQDLYHFYDFFEITDRLDD